MQRGRELNISPCTYSHINIYWEFKIQSLRREKRLLVSLGCWGIISSPPEYWLSKMELTFVVKFSHINPEKLTHCKKICGNSGCLKKNTNKQTRNKSRERESAAGYDPHFGRKIIVGEKEGSILVPLQTPGHWAMLHLATTVKWFLEWPLSTWAKVTADSLLLPLLSEKCSNDWSH